MKPSGIVLQSLRKQKGFTQVELAKKTGLTKVQISEFENGLSKPTKPELKAIIKELGITKEVIQLHMIESTDIKNPSKRDLFLQLSPMIKKLTKTLLKDKK